MSATSLYKRGWRTDALPVGTPVTIQGFLAKDGSPTANAQNVTLPDGTELFAGPRPGQPLATYASSLMAASYSGD